MNFLSIKDVIGDVGSKIFPNVTDVITQLCATLVVVLLIAKFLWKPAKKYIDRRKEYVTNNIKDAENKAEEANKLLAKAQERIDSSTNEATKIIADAKKEAQTQSELIIQKANDTAKDRLDQVELEIAHAKENAKDEVRKEIIDVAILAASKVTQKEMGSKENKQLVDEFVKDLK